MGIVNAADDPDQSPVWQGQSLGSTPLAAAAYSLSKRQRMIARPSTPRKTLTISRLLEKKARVSA